MASKALTGGPAPPSALPLPPCPAAVWKHTQVPRGWRPPPAQMLRVRDQARPVTSREEDSACDKRTRSLGPRGEPGALTGRAASSSVTRVLMAPARWSGAARPPVTPDPLSCSACFPQTPSFLLTHALALCPSHSPGSSPRVGACSVACHGRVLGTGGWAANICDRVTHSPVKSAVIGTVIPVTDEGPRLSEPRSHSREPVKQGTNPGLWLPSAALYHHTRVSGSKNAAVGRHSLLQIFPAQGLNLGLPRCRWILYRLSRQGSPF